MSNLFPFSFTNRSQSMPNIPDDEQTLIPKPEWRGARFVSTVNVPGADGTTRRFDECARNVSDLETERIAKLAPAKSDSAQWVVVYAVAALVFVAGWLAHLFFTHF